LLLDSIRSLAQAAHPIGAWVLGVSISVMLVDGILLVIFTLRYGKKDANEGKTITADRPTSSMRTRGLGISRVWTRKRVLTSRSGVVSIQSLADGTSTPVERLVVAGIVLFIFCFVLLFVGAGLMFLANNPFVMLMASFVIFWSVKLFREIYTDYCTARSEIETRNKAADGVAEPSPGDGAS